MSGNKEIIEMMERNGFVRRGEAARLVGRSDGSNIPTILKKYGVRCVQVGNDEDGIVRLMYKKEDLSKVPKVHDDLIPSRSMPGGEANGGKLRHLINDMEVKIASLELRVGDLETFKAKFE